MVTPCIPLLMLSASQPALFRALLPWLLLLLGGVLVGGALIYAARRLLQPGEDARDTVGFTLHGLRELRAEGRISEEEYERARAAMIKQVKRPDTSARERVPQQNAPADNEPAPDAPIDDADNDRPGEP